MITLKLRDNVWLAQFSGPVAARIVDLFGSSEIPTPFTGAAEPARVLRVISSKNPEYAVVLEHDDCHHCGTPAQRSPLHCTRCGGIRGMVCDTCRVTLLDVQPLCDGCNSPD